MKSIYGSSPKRYTHSSGRKKISCSKLKLLAFCEVILLAGVFIFGWNFLKLGEFADSLRPVSHEYIQATVSGSSMEPTLKNGQKILVDKNAYIKGKIAKGDIVLVEFAANKYVVKRVSDIREEQVYLAGDNANSVDSRAYGWVEKSRVVGKVKR